MSSHPVFLVLVFVNLWFLFVVLSFSCWTLCYLSLDLRGRRDRDRTVIGFITTYEICTYHHKHCEFESHTDEVHPIQQYVIKFFWLAAGRWFSPGTPVFATNKTDRYNITKILLKVVLNIFIHPSILRFTASDYLFDIFYLFLLSLWLSLTFICPVKVAGGFLKTFLIFVGILVSFIKMVWFGFWCLTLVSAISQLYRGRSVLLVEENRVPGENHRPVASHWQALSHSVVSSTPRHERRSNSQL